MFMWVTEEVSLVEFYKSGLSLAREAGYEVVLCLLAREADAPKAYDEIIKSWTSLDDVTGPKILFLFAGSSVRADHESQNILRDPNQEDPRLLFSAHALMLHSSRLDSDRAGQNRRHVGIPHYDLEFLRHHREDNHPAASNESNSRRLARQHPFRPDRTLLADRQTSQIRELREYLSLTESDVPCLHFTFLDGTPPFHHKITEQTDVYATLKSIIESVESPEVKRATADLAALEIRKRDLAKQRHDLERRRFFPKDMFMNIISQLEEIKTSQPKVVDIIEELIEKLRAHAARPTTETREESFKQLKLIRSALASDPKLKATISQAQRAIDIASEHASMNPADQETKAELLNRIDVPLNEIKQSYDNRLSELRSMLAPKDIAVPNAPEACLQSFVVVAAGQELAAVRSYLDAEGAIRKNYPLSDTWSVERISITRTKQIEFCLAIAPGQGVGKMGALLDFIQKEAAPKTVILVGMMGGIRGKSGLLDVQAPGNIIDGSRLGTRDGRIVPEPHGSDLDPTLHTRLHSIDHGRHKIDDIKVVTHKHSLCVAAKFDDLTPELAQAALRVDPENIIGIEMEGSALTARQSGHGGLASRLDI
jgi:hypothetical protein